MKDTRTFSEQTYADALASYNKTWDETYSLSVTAGGSFTKTSASSIELIGWGDKEFKVNNGVITPGAYYPNIFSPEELLYDANHRDSERKTLELCVRYCSVWI